MTPVRYLDWALSVLTGFIVIAALGSLTRKIRKKWLKALLFVLKFLLMAVLAFELIADASPFLWKFAYPLMGIYIALFADCICDLLMSVLSFFRKEEKKRLRTAVLGIIF